MNESKYLFVKTSEEYVSIDIADIERIVYYQETPGLHGLERVPNIIIKHKDKEKAMIEFRDIERMNEFIEILERYLQESHIVVSVQQYVGGRKETDC